MTDHDVPGPGREFEGVDLTGARLRKVDLSGARFRMVDLSGVMMRDISLAGASIDGGDLDGLRINGVEVAPLVEAELRRRDPARAFLDAGDPGGLQAAWAALEAGWSATEGRVATMPEAVVDTSVQEEWSFSQTLRHLVFVTDAWLGSVVDPQPRFHPWGVPFAELDEFVDGGAEALGIDPDAAPAYEQVRALRAERSATVRTFLAGVTEDRLTEECEGPPWVAGRRLSVLQCLQVLLEEECEHLRYARRDLDALELAAPSPEA